MNDQFLKSGTNGMFGPGIYFASHPKIAQLKVLHVHHFTNAFVECMVDFGDALVLDEPNYDITLDYLNKYNCNSVLGRSKDGNKWEFVVYESSRTKPIRMSLI